jgi:hypothetical protein
MRIDTSHRIPVAVMIRELRAPDGLLLGHEVIAIRKTGFIQLYRTYTIQILVIFLFMSDMRR